MKYHSIRVANLSNRLATSLHIKGDIKNIILSAIFHDIGKIYLSQSILNKPTKLNNKEFEHIKLHSIYGYNIARKLNLDNMISKNILFHHENYNGTGYPKGLHGDSIPLGARIIRVCDVFDALTSKRAYREPMCFKEALNIMEEEKYNFDPYIYKVFLNMIKEGD